MSSGRLALIAALVLLIAVILGVFLAPLPRTVRCEYELVPAGKVPVTAPLDGVLLEVADAGAVDAGARLGRYDTSAWAQRRAELTAQRERLLKKLESPMAPELTEAVREAERRLKQARKDLARTTKFKPYMQAVVHGAELELAAAKEAAKPVPSAQLEEPLANLNAQLATLEEQEAASVLSAPGAGVFTPSVRAGENVTAKQRIGVLLDASTLEARVTLPAGEVAKQGRLLTLIFPLARKTWALEADGARSVEVDNRDGALKAGARGLCELEGEPEPLINRLVATPKTG